MEFFYSFKKQIKCNVHFNKIILNTLEPNQHITLSHLYTGFWFILFCKETKKEKKEGKSKKRKPVKGKDELFLKMEHFLRLYKHLLKCHVHFFESPDFLFKM